MTPVAPTPVHPPDPSEATRPLPTEPASAAALSKPVNIPGYEIHDELGRGAMGVVYRAVQLKLHREVALKMILAGVHAGAEQLARFRREAEAVARLQHFHIVQIFEVGEHDGCPYFSLELVPGGTLADKLDGKPFPASRAAEMVAQLAGAMNFVHQRGIIHRDLKPGNVLLTPAGMPKISDFGLAKLLGEEAERTQSGAILGTPSYMAPEQAAGKVREVGPAADIYALGAILYELLTGRPPFHAETTVDTLLQVVECEPVAPRALNPQVPRSLETICMKCLQKNPAQRYPSAAALEEDLRCFLTDEPIRARAEGMGERLVRWISRHPGASFARGLAGLILLPLLLLDALGGRPPVGIPLTIVLLILVMNADRRAAILATVAAAGVAGTAWVLHYFAVLRWEWSPGGPLEGLAGPWLPCAIGCLLVGVVVGALVRDRRRTLRIYLPLVLGLVCLELLYWHDLWILQHAWLTLERPALLALLAGPVCAFVAWWLKGDKISAVLGAFFCQILLFPCIFFLPLLLLPSPQFWEAYWASSRTGKPLDTSQMDPSQLFQMDRVPLVIAIVLTLFLLSVFGGASIGVIVGRGSERRN
jgi:hypothetical protein